MSGSDLNPLGTTARFVLLAITVTAIVVYLLAGEEALAIPGIVIVGLLFAWSIDRLYRWAGRDR